jgi:hypothetical protein
MKPTAGPWDILPHRATGPKPRQHAPSNPPPTTQARTSQVASPHSSHLTTPAAPLGFNNHGRRRRAEAPVPPRLLLHPLDLLSPPPRARGGVCSRRAVAAAAHGRRRGLLPPRLPSRDGEAARRGRVLPDAVRGRGPRAHRDGAALPRL